MNSRDKIEQISEIFKTEAQVAMYLRPSARQYELTIRGVEVLETDADSAKNHLILTQRFKEENGDPSHLMGVSSYHLDTEMAFIRLELDFIETITRSAVRFGWAAWSADMNKAIMRHTFWRIYRIDETKLQDQMLRVIRRVVRCWNRLEKLRIDAIPKPESVQSPDSTGTAVQSDVPHESNDSMAVLYTIRDRIITAYVPPVRYLIVTTIGTMYLLWQTLFDSQ